MNNLQLKLPMKNLNVVEIFASLQGEGARAGEASIFIRLAGCNKTCWYCDTDWKKGKEMSVEEIYKNIKGYPIKWIVWTGGEPLLQLDEEIIKHFKEAGYKQAIETNGTKKIPQGLDYVTVSPKIPWHFLADCLGADAKINEFRYVVNVMDWNDNPELPLIDFLPHADHYYLSPVFIGDDKKLLNQKALLKSIAYILQEEPRWRLSVQQHKTWGIL
jgi:7-carboxy-7-deazaguanine synthase